jgi:AcrR family transcriptional regulator
MQSTRRAPIGRPRGFDADVALERAMLLFWAQGYEGASLADLTEAMGITKTSMYAAFGNKEELFRKALQRYLEGPAAYATLATAEPTALGVATAFLAGAVQASTLPGAPSGCMTVQGALATGEPGQTARDLLVSSRGIGQEHLRDRFRQAVDRGDLPADADAAMLARYVMTVANGIAVQAAGGATRDELQRVADAALRNWPPV